MSALYFHKSNVIDFSNMRLDQVCRIVDQVCPFADTLGILFEYTNDLALELDSSYILNIGDTIKFGRTQQEIQEIYALLEAIDHPEFYVVMDNQWDVMESWICFYKKRGRSTQFVF